MKVSKTELSLIRKILPTKFQDKIILSGGVKIID